MADEPSPSAQMLGPEAAEILDLRAAQLGINCTSCGLEMSGPGFEFLSMRVVLREKPTVVEERAFICHRDDCAEAREKLRGRATAVRPAGGWSVLTGPAQVEEEGKDGGAH